MQILLQAEGFIPLLNAEGTYLEDIVNEGAPRLQIHLSHYLNM